jgi:hypothetical protein
VCKRAAFFLLGDLAQRTAFLAEVDNEANAPALGGTHALFNGVNEIRLRAYVVIRLIHKREVRIASEMTLQVQMSEPKTSEPLPVQKKKTYEEMMMMMMLMDEV